MSTIHEHLRKMRVVPVTHNLEGVRFGLLVVRFFSDETDGYRRLWMCECDCGNVRYFSANHLLQGRRTSCGDASHKRTHGMSKTPEYRAWRNAKARCFNKNNSKYPIYGGRGITMCAEWLHSFEVFFRDMGCRPGKGYSLERRDGDGDYTKSNCVWATISEQNNNTKKNTRVEFDGEVMSVADASRRTGIRYRKLLNAVVKRKLETREDVVCLRSICI